MIDSDAEVLDFGELVHKATQFERSNRNIMVHPRIYLARHGGILRSILIHG